MLFAAIAVIVTFGLIGCGGSSDGGNGNGNGNGIVIDPVLLGTWQPYEAAILGDPIGPREAFDWDENIVRMTAQFSDDGSVTIRHYDDTQSLAATETGTWTAQGGSATLTIDGEETNIDYSLDGRVMVISFTENAAQFRTRWVPVIDAAGQAAELARTWRVTLVEVNGAVTPMADFFDVPAEATVVLSLTPGGTLYFFVAGEESQIIEAMEGAWATEGELLVIDPPGAPTLRGVWAPDNTSITFLNDDGNTAQLQLTPWAPAADRDAAVAGQWTPQSVTVNGQPVEMAEFFEWTPGTDTMLLDLWADGTAIIREMAGDDVLWAALTWWSTDGGQFTLALEAALEMDYAVAGNTLTVSFTEDGDEITIVWDRVS